MASASITGAPSLRKSAATVLWPLPSPPVSPTRSIAPLDRQPAAQLGGAYCIRHEHGNGERAHAPRDGCVCARDSVGCRVHIADDGGSFEAEELFTARIAMEEAVELLECVQAVD